MKNTEFKTSKLLTKKLAHLASLDENYTFEICAELCVAYVDEDTEPCEGVEIGYRLGRVTKQNKPVFLVCDSQIGNGSEVFYFVGPLKSLISKINKLTKEYRGVG